MNQNHIDHAPQELTIEETQSQIVENFSKLVSWEQKYQYIIEKGRNLDQPDNNLQQEKNRVKGCQSQVWMRIEVCPHDKPRRIFIQAYSDAAIVSGLIALLLEVYNGHTAEEILNAKLDFLAQIGLIQHLSPNRKNGLAAMLKQIHLLTRQELNN